MGHQLLGAREGERLTVELDGPCGEWHITLTVTDEASIGIQVGD